jgi:hypothetical protein
MDGMLTNLQLMCFLQQRKVLVQQTQQHFFVAQVVDQLCLELLMRCKQLFRVILYMEEEPLR